MGDTGGRLYVVATPIGNLEDISPRARRILAEVDVVLAEDTRHTKRLLNRIGISARLEALHEHNESQRVETLADRVAAGEVLALVSDSGTPLVSDPGYRLVDALRARDLPVYPVPGPSAVIAALSVGGLPTDRFVFEGFLPARAGPRRKRLQELAEETRTLVFFEAPHRVLASLADMVAVFGGQRPGTLARELTKLFETVRRAPLGQLYDWVSGDADQQRGEVVLLVAGAEPRDDSGESAERVLSVLLAELPPSQAVRLARRITGEKRNRLYEMASRMAHDRGPAP